MKKLWVMFFCIAVFLACAKKDIDVSPVSDIDNLPTIQTFNNKEGYLMKANEDLTVIVVQSEMDPLSCAAQPSHRFIVANLPAELKGKHETKIIFSGEVKQFDQTELILYAGMPLKLTRIKLK
ncbi:hypothetical protein [Emticicia sp. BO119]|uniref:hypothetical protein n=1 Tax=Emticicia sp. BO119 TaxID=2757768 RepID=UPI0015F037D9|nr:hypothetical protein [Emticicia sp. BO119]MBA4851577.1 hypothetical protein [Emticicia sp. BO119]